MDEQRYKELSAIADGYQTVDTGTYYGAPSSLGANEALRYVAKQHEYDTEFETAKAFYNGAVLPFAKGGLGVAKMVRDGYNEATGNTTDKDNWLDNAIQSKPMERYNVEPSVYNDFVEAGGQLAVQMAIARLTGGKSVGGVGASTAVMAGQIAGNQFIELAKDGVKPSDAALPVLGNTIVQGLLEHYGIEKLIKSNALPKGMRNKAKEVLKGFITEGATEGLQSFPDQLSNIWAKNPDMDLGEIGNKWAQNAGANLKEAGYSGFIGGLTGGAAKAVHLTYAAGNNRWEQYQHDSLLSMQDERLDSQSKSGENPNRIRDILVGSLSSHTIGIDGQELKSYAQEAGAEKVAEALGTSVEEIEAAADLGMDVTVAQANYESAANTFKGFHKSMRSHINFYDGDYSTNAAELKSQLHNKYEELDDTPRIELDNAVKLIVDSAVEAGVAKGQAESLRMILQSRALIARPDNPAQFFRDHALEYVNANELKDIKGFYMQEGTEPAAETEKASENAAEKQQDAVPVESIVKEGFNAVKTDVDGGTVNGKQRKGQIAWDNEGKAIISLFKGADASTVIHETGHYFVEAMAKDVASGIANAGQRKDFEKLLEYCGMTLEQWNSADFEGRRQAHEKLAEAFETYIMEGKAPNMELMTAFKRFGLWLKAVYAAVARSENAAPLTADVKGAFDRWLATEYEIQAIESVEGWYARLPKIMTQNLSPKYERMMKDYIAQAHDEAVDILTKWTMGRYAGQQKAKIAAFRKKVRAQAEADVSERPVYKVIAYIESLQNEGIINSKLSPKSIALRYLNSTGKQYASWDEELKSVNAQLDEYLSGHKKELKKGMDAVSKIYVERETGKAADASDLLGQEETAAGDENSSYREEYDYGDSEPWFIKWYDEHKRKMTSADIDELAHDLAIGIDRYHVYGNDIRDYANTDEGDAHFSEVEKQLPYLEERKEQLVALAAGKRADYHGNITRSFADADMLLKKGVDHATIKKLTGWSFSNGEWHYDVSGEFSFNLDKIPDTGKRAIKLMRVFDGGELFNKFSFLKDIKIKSGVNVKGMEGAKIKTDHFAYANGYIYIEHAISGLDPKKNAGDIRALNGEIAQILEQVIAEKGVEVDNKKPMLVVGKSKLGNVNVNAEPWRATLKQEDRVSFELLAESFGFTSGDHLATNIINAEPYNAAVERRIDSFVDEQFPDLLADRKAAAERAREALYNDNSGMVLALEEQLISEQLLTFENRSLAAQAKAELAAELKARAEAIAKEEIAGMKMRDAMRTKNFMMAERRAAGNAAKALEAGDFESARQFKLQQAVQHALARESIKLKEQTAKSAKYLRKLRNAKKDKWGNEQHFAQAAMLMQRMGIGHADFTPEMRTQTLVEYVQEMSALYDCVDIPAWLLDETVPLNTPKDMTSAQYNDCVNALKNIQAIVKQEQYVVAVAKGVDYGQWKQKAMERLGKLKDRFVPKPGEKQKPGVLEKSMASLRQTDNLWELMDGWTYGFFSKTFGESLKVCADNEWEMLNEYETFAAKAYQKWLPTQEAVAAADEKTAYAELGDGAAEGAVSVDKHVLVQMLANLGNDGNARRLCGMPPIGFEQSKLWVKPDDPNNAASVEEAYQQTKANLLEFLGKNLTKADIEYAQSLIDNANRYWADLAALERRTKGFAPEKVAAVPVTMKLADGSTVLFKGGYLPLVRDGQMGSRPQGVEMVSATDENAGKNILTMHTDTSSSKSRIGGTYPVDLSRGAELRAIQATIHDICYREIMADFRKVFNDPEMYAILKRKLGIANLRQFQEMLEKTAQPKGRGADLAEETTAHALNWLRRKTVNAAIMLNLKTSLQNIGNIFLYGNVIDGFDYKDVVAAMGRYGLQGLNHQGANELNEICSKSAFMKQRVLLPDITMADVTGEDVSAIDRKIAKWGALMLSYTDNITAKPMWAQAYAKKISQGATEQEAINFADAVVRRTLGSGRVQDVSSLQRGSALWKLFTSFQGFFNTQYNQWEREANVDYRLIKEGKRDEAAMRIAAFVASKYLFTCMAALVLSLENPFEEDDDGWTKLSKEMIGYPTSMLGPVGQAGYQFVNSLLGIRTYGYRLSAIQSTIDRGFKLGRGLQKVASGKAGIESLAEPTTSALLPLIGVPDQLNRWFWNAWDILYNDMDPEFGDLIRRRPKKER